MTSESHREGNVRSEVKGALRCAGCNRVFEVGDLYIEDTSSGFTKSAADETVDDLIAGIFGGSDGKVRLCEVCTQAGGVYTPKTFTGTEGAA